MAKGKPLLCFFTLAGTDPFSVGGFRMTSVTSLLEKRTPVLLLPLLAVPYKVQVLYFSKNKYSINSMNVKEVKNILEKSGEGKIIIKIYIF